MLFRSGLRVVVLALSGAGARGGGGIVFVVRGVEVALFFDVHACRPAALGSSHRPAKQRQHWRFGKKERGDAHGRSGGRGLGFRWRLVVLLVPEEEALERLELLGELSYAVAMALDDVVDDSFRVGLLLKVSQNLATRKEERRTLRMYSKNSRQAELRRLSLARSA